METIYEHDDLNNDPLFKIWYSLIRRSPFDIKYVKAQDIRKALVELRDNWQKAHKESLRTGYVHGFEDASEELSELINKLEDK
jgi:hypothetical protein